MTKQSSSTREKLSSASNTSFHHSPSSNITKVVVVVVDGDSGVDGDSKSSVNEQLVSRNHTTSIDDDPPPLTPTTYMCASGNQSPIASSCADSLDEYSSFGGVEEVELPQHSSPTASLPVKNEHFRINIDLTLSSTFIDSSIPVDSTFLRNTVASDCCSCLSGNGGSGSEWIGATNIKLPRPQLLSPASPISPASPVQKAISTSPEKNVVESSETFDCLSSLSTSVFKLKNYSTAGNRPPSSTCYSVKNSPFSIAKCSDDKKGLSVVVDPSNDSSSLVLLVRAADSSTTELNSIKTIPSLAPTSISNTLDSNLNDPDNQDCYACKRKLPLTMIVGFKCKCGFHFCTKHRHAELHHCTYDYKAEKKAYLRKNITTVVADKVRKI